MTKNAPPVTHRFKIDRSRWASGSRSWTTSLYNNEETDPEAAQGAMCCLGFLAESCRVQKKARAGVSYPSALPYNERGVKKLWSLLKINDPENADPKRLEKAFAEVNDAEDGGRVKREQRLTKMFREIGIQVKFSGTY